MHLTRRRTLLTGLLLPMAAARAQPAMPAPRVLEAKAGTAQIVADSASETPILAYGGTLPGPILRLKPDEELRVRLVNALQQPTAIHWQGVRLPNAMDGAADLTQSPVSPGAQFDIAFRPPDAGTYWFRPSCQPFAAEQKARGLSGVLIVEEQDSPPVDDEMVVVIDDLRLDAAGAPPIPFTTAKDVSGEGRIGGIVTVNGKPVPTEPNFRPGARLRLRIVNACNARMVGLMFEGLQPFVIGVDGQACQAFEPVRKTIPVGPGARFDVIVDLPGDASAKPALVLRGGGLRSDSTEPDRPLLAFQIEGARVEPRGPVRAPALNPLLPAVIRLEAAKRLDLAIEGPGKDPAHPWTLNGLTGSVAAKPLLMVKRGQAISMGFVNKTALAHSFHLHGHVMRVLHPLDDGWEPYWRDSIIIPPGKTVRVAFVADNPGKWLVESSILEHAAAGLWGWFEVA